MHKGYSKIPHFAFVDCLTINEKMMLLAILDAENRFQKDWVGIGLSDWYKVGFGHDGNSVRDTRSSLLEKGLIEYKQGRKGVLSQFRVVEDLEEKISNLETEYEAEPQVSVYIPQPEPIVVEEPPKNNKIDKSTWTEEEWVIYLVNLENEKGKDKRVYEMNEAVNIYGKNWDLLWNGFNKVKAGV